MRKLKGTIVSNKMTKTVVVKVERLKRHPKYLKHYRVSKKYKAHVEDAAAFNIGDQVMIQEMRPMSKEKKWKVVEVIKRALSEEAEKENSEISNV